MDAAQQDRRRRRNTGTLNNCCHELNSDNSTMVNRSFKRRRYEIIPLFMAIATLPTTATARLRSRTLNNSCYRYDNSPEIVNAYLPSFSYNPSQLASRDGLIYECKPFPFNGWCGDYEPGNTAKPWGDAWILVGECFDNGPPLQEEIMEEQSAAAAVENNLDAAYTVDGLPPCSISPPFSTVEVYYAEDIVFSNGMIYKCQADPAAAWCSLGGYEPGSGMYWNMAWEVVGDCFMDELALRPHVEDSEPSDPKRPTSFSEAASSLTPCAPLYISGETYTTQSVISFDQYNYECAVPVWCNLDDYAPSHGNTMTAAAWSKMDECSGVVTALPTISPVEPSESPTTPSPVNWVDIFSDEAVIVPIEEDSNALSFFEDTDYVRTRRPSPSPSRDSAHTHLTPCAPLFTVGHEFIYKELISFNGYNYECANPEYCSQVRYAPRTGEENQGVAWWKIDECYGDATRHPTPPPTAARATRPTGSNKFDVVMEDRDSFYASRVPMPILKVLNENKLKMQKMVLVSQTVDWDWEYSSLYTFEDFVVALGVITDHPVITPFFLGGFGSQSRDEALLYGLVNIAAFLSQAMVESIKFDTCDEANWDFVNNHYPLSNACGQGGKSYQDMTCSEEYAHMQCPVKKDMKATAATGAKWFGGADGAPGPLYCQPKTSSQPYSGVWDYLYNCNRPHEDPPEYCDVYEGQNGGRYDNSFPAGNGASRSDVEGCCWWGRGVIQTRGTCDIGKINHFLGSGAENSPYPSLDFCDDPQALCSSTQYTELKWVAGMASWTMLVQPYNQGGWEYIPELIEFVDGGMVDESFIAAVSRILISGCHDDSCGEVEPEYERAKNFKMILDDVFEIGALTVEAGRTFTPTSKPTKRTRMPSSQQKESSSKPTIRTRKPRTSQPTPQLITEMPTGEPTTQMPTTSDMTPVPSLRPTEWQPWYCK